MSRTARILMLTVLVAGGLAFSSGGSEAEASAVGCTASGSKASNCIDVQGVGLHVDSVRAIRSEYGSYTMCNYKARMTAIHNGSYVEPVRWEYGPNGCSYGSTAWLDFYPNRNYPDGTVICVYFYMNGSSTATPGAPCQTVKAPPDDDVEVNCDIVAPMPGSREPVLLAIGRAPSHYADVRLRNCPPDA